MSSVAVVLVVALVLDVPLELVDEENPKRDIGDEVIEGDGGYIGAFDEELEATDDLPKCAKPSPPASTDALSTFKVLRLSESIQLATSSSSSSLRLKRKFGLKLCSLGKRN